VTGDGNDLWRKREADGGKRRTNPFAVFGDGLVRQPDNREFRNARCQLHLDFDRTGFEAEICNGGDGRGHQAPPREHSMLYRSPPSSAEQSETVMEQYRKRLERALVCHQINTHGLARQMGEIPRQPGR
jgi:hypothetical protein